MGLLSIFRRATPEEVCDGLSHVIVYCSLSCRTRLDTHDKYRSAKAGEEFAFLLLHMVDRQAFSILGPKGRDLIFYAVCPKVIYRYTASVLRKEAPKELLETAREGMWNAVNDRQYVYSRCKTLMGEEGGWPGEGTLVFALSYYVNRALGRINEIDGITPILCGDKPLKADDCHRLTSDSVDCLLEWPLRLSHEVVEALKALRLPSSIKKIRGREHELAHHAA